MYNLPAPDLGHFSCGSEIQFTPRSLGLQFVNVLIVMVIPTLTIVKLPGNVVELWGTVVAKDTKTNAAGCWPRCEGIVFALGGFFLLQPSSPGGAITHIFPQMTLVSATVIPASVPWLFWLILKQT